MALAPREVDYLSQFQALSRRYPSGLANAALETAILRREAQSKFPFASKLYLTREALQQASSWEVSTYRAERYRSHRRVLDLGCSVGGDTLGLAQVAPVVGLDHDPLRLAMARANARALGVSAKTGFVCADLGQPLPAARSLDLDALFFDPARRVDGRRVFSVDHYRPPLSIINAWSSEWPALGVKISPGVDRDELSAYQAEVEFISLRGELKEAVLWFGPLKSTTWRATVLPGAFTLTPDPQSVCPLDEPRAYLYEPDPAILRAGLVQTLAARMRLAQLDRQIAYLTGDDKLPTPFARVWAVEDWMPFNLKRLRAYLRQRGIGRVTVKKRGSPIQPEALIRDLRLKGELERVIFLTKLRDRPVVLICFP
jgi:SAM-dependent methyltransferase